MDTTSEISLTLYHPPSSKTDAISISKLISVDELAGFAVALLDLAADADADSNASIVEGAHQVVLARSIGGEAADMAGVAAVVGGNRLVVISHPNDSNKNNKDGQQSEKEKTLESCNITDGTIVLVYRLHEFEILMKRSTGSGANASAHVARNAMGSGGGNGGGSLDFSALLGGSAPSPSASTMTPTNVSNSYAVARGSAGGGSLDFSSLLTPSTFSGAGGGMANASATVVKKQKNSIPIQWDGMTLDAAIKQNPNPHHLMSILTNTSRHPNLFKELNYHHPALCKQLQSANGDLSKMADIWRINTMKSTTSRFLKYHSEKSKEESMRQRLLVDPTDAIANKYFGNKIRLSNVQAQYEQMMEEYPESMGRVLMLYINCTANGQPLQVFVDSGAQNTIMSGRCAERLNLSHLIDTRFAGVAVGVGTGKIAGRIHVVTLNIGGYDLPCSITGMEDGNDGANGGKSTGMGDKNMDCLFGLDMLKRHRCCIDLGKNVLRFAIGHGNGGDGVEYMEEPFLHEKDLPASKGGTMDFNAEEENAMVEARLERMDTDEDDDEGTEAGKRNDGDGESEKVGE